MVRILVVVFEGVQTLDATGPAEVFAAASASLGTQAYRVLLASIGGGPRTTSSALRLHTCDLRRIRPSREDIVVVAGGGERAIGAAMGDRALIGWLKRASKVVRRTTSVCSGAFILAGAGILDGRRATTHWVACERLARMFPQVNVEPNAIFVQDGAVWTSAGVTTGIDMALAIVEQDLGRALADAVAAALVLYVRRPGFQSQFSGALVAQTSSSDPLGPAIAWVRANLAKANVESLAERAGLSLRTLYRRCEEQLGMTPAKLVDKLRIEHARTLLATSDLSAKLLAVQCGFSSAAHMKRTFERELGMGSREYRLLHATRT
jgi:transcriptional regulator GlxA family with amidase domain